METAEKGAEASAVHRLTRRYQALTASQRQMADYVLAHRFEAATLAIDALARRCAVSVASANRFVRALGYASYASFREHWQGELKPATSTLDKLVRQQQAQAGAGDVLRGALLQGASSLQQAETDLDEDQAAALVAALLQAPRVGVFGAEVSAYLAGYFANYLSLFRGGVECLPGLGGPTEPFRKLLAYGPGDVLLVLSLPRYSALTLELCEFAAGRGIPVAAITDSPAAPVVKHARHVLYAPAGGTSLPASSLGALALLEGLCTAMASHSTRLSQDLPLLSQTTARHYVQGQA